MAKPPPLRYIDTSNELLDAEAEPYMRVFQDAYWWLPPSLDEPNPAVTPLALSAHFLGRSLLADFARHNDGMQRLHDATSTHETSVLDARPMGQSTVVQVVQETLVRNSAYKKHLQPGKYSAEITDEGFKVTNQREGFADYEMRTRWFAVAGAYGKRNGFFELRVDHTKSHSSLADDGVMVALKIVGSNTVGTSHLIGGETLISRTRTHERYERIRKMRVFTPMQVGSTHAFIDTDISKSQPS